MISASIILLVLANIVSSIFIFHNIRKFYTNKIIIDFVLYIFLVSQILFFLIPSVLRIFSNWKYESLVEVYPLEVAHVFLVEYFSFTIWLLTILILAISLRNNDFQKINFKSFSRMFRDLKNDGREYYFQLLKNKKSTNIIINFSLIVMVIAVIYLYNMSHGFGRTFVPELDWLLYPFVMKSAKLFALLIVFFGYKVAGIYRYILSLILAIYIYSFDLSDGSLGSIIAPASYLFFLAVFVKNNRFFKFIIFASTIFVLFFFNDMHNMRSYHFDKSPLERLSLIFTETSETQKHSNFSLLDKLEYRLGVPSKMSVGYVRMYDDGRPAWHKPFFNSLYSTIPRRFYPNKPVSGSLNGDKLSTGPHLINGEIENRIQNMSGHYTGLHSYWEAGYLGVIFLSIFSGVYTYFLFGVLDRLGNASLFITLVAYDTWWGIVKLWSSEIVIQVFTYMIPLLFFYFSFSLFCRLRIKISTS